EDLAVDVGDVDGVVVDDRDVTDTRGGQRLHRRAAEAAGPDDQHVGAVQRLLLRDPVAGQGELAGGAPQFRLGEHYSTWSDQETSPSKLEEATACSRRGMRPAPAARRPASTACFMACAIATGSWERLTAEASSTPSQPSSMARA